MRSHHTRWGTQTSVSSPKPSRARAPQIGSGALAARRAVVARDGSPPCILDQQRLRAPGSRATKRQPPRPSAGIGPERRRRLSSTMLRAPGSARRARHLFLYAYGCSSSRQHRHACLRTPLRTGRAPLGARRCGRAVPHGLARLRQTGRARAPVVRVMCTACSASGRPSHGDACARRCEARGFSESAPENRVAAPRSRHDPGSAPAAASSSRARAPKIQRGQCSRAGIRHAHVKDAHTSTTTRISVQSLTRMCLSPGRVPLLVLAPSAAP